MTARHARKRTWRKRLTRAILCLLLGAVTTVAVAWGCVAWSQHPTTWVPSQPGPWPAPMASTWPAPMLQTAAQKQPRLTVYDAWAVTRIEAHYWPQSLGETLEDRLSYGQHRTNAGWPLPSLTRWQNFGGPVSSTEFSFEHPPPEPWWIMGIPIRREDEPRPRWLPLIPMPGFFLDTLFYAAPWWLFLFGPGTIRRFRRRRRGRCIHCGYDLAGLAAGDGSTPTCPECGA